MNFKKLLESDMKVFHNTGEMATITDIWYQGKMYNVPLIIDHTAADERRRLNGDNVEGLHTVSCLVYISLYDLGFIPKQGRTIEIDEAGAIRQFEIKKADHEDGEIILELEVLEE